MQAWKNIGVPAVADRVRRQPRLSLAAIAVLHALTTSSEVGGEAWAAPGRRPDELLVAVLAWVGLALAGWLALGSALALLSRLPGTLGRSCALLAQHLTPMLLRRVMAAAVGTSTVSVALPPATVVGTVAAPRRRLPSRRHPVA